MGDIKLFRILDKKVTSLKGTGVSIEKSLQNLLESHLDSFLGVKFLASEHSTGKVHGGRIDTLGIDENGCPVIIEYKRAINQNVINQGLFYLDWLMDHKAEFELLVLKMLNKKSADSIEWSNPRLLCIASDYTKYDQYAVQQINRNIELLRYRKFDDDLLMLELVNAVSSVDTSETPDKQKKKQIYSTVSEQLGKAPQNLLDIFNAVTELCQGFGDDVQVKTLKFYIAFKRLRNFASFELRITNKCALLFVYVDLKRNNLEKGFSRDVSKLGHFGTGNVELTLRTIDDVEKARPLLEKSYELS